MKIGIANPSRAEMDKFLSGVVGVVEANSYESMCLWRERHEQRGQDWKSGGGGPMVQVGELADMPVCISLLVNEVDGHRILFVDATSRVVDHEMIRDWLNANVPVTAFEGNDPRKRLNITNAMNFGNVFPRASAIEARQGGDGVAGSVEDESAVTAKQADAQPSQPPSKEQSR